MYRSSESIALFAAALAKAQITLTSPEKSLIGTVPSDDPVRNYAPAPAWSRGMAAGRQSSTCYRVS
jgi:hypothetical protein